MIHILFAILVLTLLALAFGIILGFAAVKFHVEADPIGDPDLAWGNILAH